MSMRTKGKTQNGARRMRVPKNLAGRSKLFRSLTLGKIQVHELRASGTISAHLDTPVPSIEFAYHESLYQKRATIGHVFTA